MGELDRARAQADRYHAAFTEGTGMPDPRPERRAMTTDPIEVARLGAIKAICKREKHNWIGITSYSDLPLTRSMCRRGCGATRYGIHHGATLTPQQLAQLMPANGSVTVTDIEIIVEDDDA